MAEKSGRYSFSYGNKPVPMKLFATWEVDKTPPYCIPRLCTMRLSRVILLKTLGNDVSSILIAVKMQSSKRILRSNEIMLHSNGLLDTELDLTFSLQYPHFLKRDGNKLQVMIQRRKRYKNRTILGYKTLAIGSIDMSQVLQKPVDLELELLTGEGSSSGKTEGTTNLGPTSAPTPAGPALTTGQVCAKISVVSLSSQPVDQESSSVPRSFRRKTGVFADAAGSAGERDGDFSDDEDDFSSNEEGSDSEPMVEETHAAVGPRQLIPRKSSRSSKAGLTHTSARQRNLKQKFVALLKRFKVSEDFQNVFATGAPGIDEQREMDPEDIEDWIDELEDLGAASCESGNEEDEEDTLSISSTPKPSLRPFFSSRSLLHESLSPPGVAGPDRASDESSKKGDSDSHPDHNTTDAEHSDPPPPVSSQYLGASSSPPKGSSGDEMRTDSKPREGREGKETKSSSGFSDILYGAKTLFPKDWGSSGPGSSSKEKKSSSAKEKERDRSCTSGSQISGLPCQFSYPDFNAQPRKVLLEQLGRLMPSGSDDSPPSSLLIVSTLDPQGALVASLLNANSSYRPAICTAGHADVRATVNCIVNRIQRYCNSNAKSPNPVKIVLVGSDSHVNAAVKPFVEQLSSRPPDWQSYIRFLIVPLGLNNLSRYISSIDNGYNGLFGYDGGWRDLLEKEELIRKADGHEILSRISRYVESSSGYLQLPIAEAMITYKEKSSDEGSSQVFIPFISEVRIAFPEPVSSTSVDLDEGSAGNVSGNSPSGLNTSAGSGGNLGLSLGVGGPSSLPCASSPPSAGGVSGSPPNQLGASLLEARARLVGDTTPPSSPNIGMNHPPSYSQEPLDLQIDYWLSPGSTRSSSGAAGERGERGALDRSLDGGRGPSISRGDSVVSGSLMGDGERSSKGSGKCSLRSSFRSLVIQRRPPLGETSSTHHFMMTYSLKEKKQKNVIQRLGKKKSEKEKDTEGKSITVEGINRLVCMARAQNNPLRVTIDGIEWSGVKFFQLSSQWQTHVKHFPIATIAPFTYVLSDR